MEYYVRCEGIGMEEDEQKITIELNVGDYCQVDLENGDEAIIKIIKRTYYPFVKQWIFWGQLEIN